MIRVCPLSALPRGAALRLEAEPPIAVFHTEEGEVFANDDTCTRLPRRGLGRGLRGGVPAARPDSVSVEEGSVEGRDVLAISRRGEEPVAVLGMNQARLFGRWRRQINAAAVPA